MAYLSPSNLNEITITGQVVGVTYYEDHDKLVFTLKNPEGNFCVEARQIKTREMVSRGDQVIVRGALFSLRSGRNDIPKIRANLILSFYPEE